MIQCLDLLAFQAHFSKTFGVSVQSSLEACWVALEEYQFIIWCSALHTLLFAEWLTFPS